MPDDSGTDSNSEGSASGSGGGGSSTGGGGGEGGGSDSGSTSFDANTQASNLDTGNELLSSEDILTRGRELALRGVPLNISSLFEALARLRATAAGSTAEIFPQVIGQISALRSQYSGASQAIARRLGFAGGGQVERARQGLLSGAAKQYGGVIANAQQAGFGNLLTAEGNFQPVLSGAARPPSTSIKTQPTNFAPYGAALSDIISTGSALSKTRDAQFARSTIDSFRTGAGSAGLAPVPDYSVDFTGFD